VIQYFKDDATAFNAKKRGTIEDKGVVNNRMSELFFELLERNGVRTHWVKRLSDR
jgi:phosphoribosylaminoimidazole-succinocarboxamide synthase